jgi:lysophospholipase III
MDARLNKSASVHIFCQKTTKDFFNIWLNLELLVPLVIDCWIDNVKLTYDNVTRTTRNQDGVETRIPGWGTSEVVEWLDPSLASTGSYFKDIGNSLVGMGYKRGLSMRGAPYDFRKGPSKMNRDEIQSQQSRKSFFVDENSQWFVDMKALVEETFSQNNNTPVSLIVHSMGAPMSLLFLQRQDKAWKAKHIARIISLAGAWGGSAKAVKVFAIGEWIIEKFLAIDF